jgi:hypothetical protein
MAVHGDKSRIGEGCAIATADGWYREAVEKSMGGAVGGVQGDGRNVVGGTVRDSNTALSDGSRKKLVQRRTYWSKLIGQKRAENATTVIHVTDLELGRYGQTE